MDFKNPIFLIVLGVGGFAAYILLKDQGTPTTAQQAQPMNSPLNPQGNINNSPDMAINPVGGSYSYMDGSGAQHIIATDPYGNLVGYSNLPPDTSQPQTNQMASYVGGMSGQYLVPPWGSTSPYYSMASTNYGFSGIPQTATQPGISYG